MLPSVERKSYRKLQLILRRKARTGLFFIISCIYLVHLIFRPLVVTSIIFLYTNPTDKIEDDHTVSMATILLSDENICQQNPYLSSVSYNMAAIREYQRQLPVLHRRATSWFEAEHGWNHGRFRAFQELAQCHDVQCIGGPCRHDRSKIVCGFEALAAATTFPSETSSSCIVYSLGSNNQWEFERDVLNQSPCLVHTFDCTGDRARFQVPQHDRLAFHYECLYGGDVQAQGRRAPNFYTLDEIMSRHGHTQVDLFKIDIEGYEWGVFENFVSLRNLPMQVLVEIHWLAPFWGSYKSEADIVTLAEKLLDMGYVVVQRDDNNRCRFCTELTLLRLFC